MHFLKMVLMIWSLFGVLTTLGFLWLGRKGVKALEQPARREPAFTQRKKPVVVARSNAA